MFPLLTRAFIAGQLSAVLASPPLLTPALVSFYAQLGAKVRTARLFCGLSQEELARRVGLTRTSVTNIEKGRQKVLVHTLVDLARVLKVPVQNLLPSAIGAGAANLSERLPVDLSKRAREWIESRTKKSP